MMNKNYNPVETIYGSGSIRLAGELAKKYSNTSYVLVFTGQHAMKEQGILRMLENRLIDAGFRMFVSNDVKPNPTLKYVEEKIKQYNDARPGLIIGLGGGSVMDVAKTVAVMLPNKGDLAWHIRKKQDFLKPSIPVIQIPTTAGTGSEVTRWATIWNEGFKYSLSHEYMYAKAAILDPRLTLKLPKEQTAITGMDALCHAIEAYWSRNRNPMSDMYALSAIKDIYFNLDKAYNDPQSREYRTKVLLGSHKAGLAISGTKTTAIHSVSYPLTGFFGMPHGMACGVLLPAFIEYNYNKKSSSTMAGTAQRIETIAKVCGCEDVHKLWVELLALLGDMELPTSFVLSKKELLGVVRLAFTKGRIDNNPRKVTKKSLTKLLEGLSC